jgi:ribonuclease HIII
MSYALTPYTDEPAATAQSAVATTAITTLATTPTATDIAVAVNSLIARQAALTTLANQIRSDLVSLAAIKGSA